MKLKKLKKKPLKKSLNKLKSIFKRDAKFKENKKLKERKRILKKHQDEEDKLDIKPDSLIALPPEVEKKSEKFYVNPELFKQHIEKFNKTDIISNEVAKYIYDIANRMGFATNFINYTYREEMIGDATIKMFQALKNKKYDPKKGNPFSYFSMIAFNAFCNRIKKEKRTREALNGYQEQVYETIMTSGLLPDDQFNEDHHDNHEQSGQDIKRIEPLQKPSKKTKKEEDNEDI